MTLQTERDRQSLELEAAVDFVRKRVDASPSVAIILGSGLGGLADRIERATCIPFGDIPGFGTSSASGHRGQLILGEFESTKVVAMAGRFHRYEGWSNDQVAFPVQLMSAIGAACLIVSNAAGGVSPKLKVGDIVVIRDHINLIPGRATWVQADRAPWLTHQGELYDLVMSRVAMEVAIGEQFNAYEGTYLATLGPTYETRSEYRMMRRIGADVVGMSTVPEVLAAAHVKMRVLGLSMVSNVANPDRPIKADHAEVLKAGRDAEVKMEAIVRGVLRSV
jgi:purine-nucleoside phosphorylase